MPVILLGEDDPSEVILAALNVSGAARKGTFRVQRLDRSVVSALSVQSSVPCLVQDCRAETNLEVILRSVARAAGLERLWFETGLDLKKDLALLSVEGFSAAEAATLNTSLTSDTFLSPESNVGVADLVHWIRSVNFTRTASDEALQQIPSFCRWFDHVRSLVGIENSRGVESLTERLKAMKEGQVGPKSAKGIGKKEANVKPPNGKEMKAADERPLNDPTRMELRVGRIIEVWEHPDADSLYCERIDIGEEKPREIASGLRKFVPKDKMQGAMIIVFANLKPKALRGFPSHGMVLCASSADHTVVELMHPPKGAKVGDLVTYEGLQGDFEAVLSNKKGADALGAILPHLKTDAECFGSYMDGNGKPHKILVGGEPIWCETLKMASLS